MTSELIFLPVGNADSIVIQDENSVVIVDLGKPRVLERWLRANSKKVINRIYITHAHGDHFPSLVKLVEFLDLWFKQGTLEHFHLPYQIYQSALRKLQDKRNSNTSYQRLEHALNKLYEWDRDSIVRFSPAVRNAGNYSQGVLSINVLHPTQLYVERHLASSNSKLNEISLVIEVTYGNFVALLLADIEGAGLKEFLDSVSDNNCKAHLVKIPHHGAWPVNGNDLENLLAKIDAEIAVLSVGSTNSYGHVRPELFKALLALKADTSQRLSTFICTEITQTCANSLCNRVPTGVPGLPAQRLCAGEIVIAAEVSGKWQFKGQYAHEQVIDGLQYAACTDRAEL